MGKHTKVVMPLDTEAMSTPPVQQTRYAEYSTCSVHETNQEHGSPEFCKLIPGISIIVNLLKNVEHYHVCLKRSILNQLSVWFLRKSDRLKQSTYMPTLQILRINTCNTQDIVPRTQWRNQITPIPPSTPQSNVLWGSFSKTNSAHQLKPKSQLRNQTVEYNILYCSSNSSPSSITRVFATEKPGANHRWMAHLTPSYLLTDEGAQMKLAPGLHRPLRTRRRSIRQRVAIIANKAHTIEKASSERPSLRSTCLQTRPTLKYRYPTPQRSKIVVNG